MPVSPVPRNRRSSSRRNIDQSRAWQRMLSGRRLDLLDPSPIDVEILDIAHGLARVSRWNGQTKGIYPLSVAQHSLLVEKIMSLNAPKLERRWRLAALLHDAPEYVIGDMISPFKYALGGIYRDIESRLEAAIHIRFGLPATLPEAVKRAIKRADGMAAWLEATQLAGVRTALSALTLMLFLLCSSTRPSVPSWKVMTTPTIRRSVATATSM